ncbi:MAG: DNA-processing protein DprA [Rhodospirillales bacterium]|jgi:DNA processing protein|nr:DNA-processing protein DprA [Rhodospirillales bacterium]MDP6884297.1 DNA-processing protein DprA [Rhodospirillales bacterium]
MNGPTRTLSAAERLDWLRLIRSENVGPITFYRLIERFGTAARALEALPDLARRGGRRKPMTVCPPAVAEREMEAQEAIGAVLVARVEPAYPPNMFHIEDAPPLIGVLGQGHLLARPIVAVVGARNASLNGRRFAERLAADLGKGVFVVVSGLARGIDASAHAGALETGTVAVVAGGIDVIYPKENERLYGEIAERGAIISEIEPGTSPQARHFPRRNRLISGMALGVVVVEASLRSGSLITARLALEQGREVFAVPGSPLDPRARGTNDLLRQGATMCESAEDIIRTLDDTLRMPLSERKTPGVVGVRADSPSLGEIDSARAAILEYLSPTPVMVDEIIRNGHFSPAVVSMVLLELELAGRLERQPGNQVALIKKV